MRRCQKLPPYQTETVSEGSKTSVLEQASGRACGPMERGDHPGGVLLSGLVTTWGIHIEAICSWRTAPLGKDPCSSSLWRIAACGKDHVEVHGGLSPMSETPQWRSGKEWGGRSGRYKLVMNWLQPPFPTRLCHLKGRGREIRSEIEPGKKGGLGKRRFEI